MSVPVRDPSRPTAEVFTIKDIAAMTRIHPQKLRRLERAGVLPEARRTQLFQRRYWLPGDLPELWRRLAAYYKEHAR